MKKPHLLAFGLSVIFISLSSVYAQSAPFSQAQNTFGALDLLVQALTSGLIKNLGYMFMGLAAISFVFGLVQFIWSSREGNEPKISQGKRFMLWGLVGLFVMFSMYGLVRFMQATLGITDNSAVDLPNLNLRPNQAAGSFAGMASAPRLPSSGGSVSSGGGSGSQSGAGATSGSVGAVTVGGVPVCDQSKTGQTCQGAGGTCIYARQEGQYACVTGLPAGTQTLESLRALAVQKSNGGGTVGGQLAIRVGNATINVKGGTTFAEISKFFNSGTSGQATSGGSGTSGAGVEKCTLYCNTPGTSCVNGTCLASTGLRGQAACDSEYGAGYIYNTSTSACDRASQSGTVTTSPQSQTSTAGQSTQQQTSSSWFDNPFGTNASAAETCVFWCSNGGTCTNGACQITTTSSGSGSYSDMYQSSGSQDSLGVTSQNSGSGLDSFYADPIPDYSEVGATE